YNRFILTLIEFSVKFIFQNTFISMHRKNIRIISIDLFETNAGHLKDFFRQEFAGTQEHLT
ncbi:hypothetical protein ACFTRA_18860, partial [Bacillus spizizenii]|uniref:hypothetical protein n=1 Tax=Bacillus spizizenii TaxID=96241 RepID=UPI00363DE2DB